MYRKLLFLIAIIFFINISSKAQVKLCFGADSNDVISNIILDKFGNFYVAANFSNTIILDKISNRKTTSRNNSQDILLAKFNTLGKLIWYKKIGGDAKDEVHDLKLDTYGNLYLVGSFSNECLFESATKKTSLISKGKTDGFIAKYLSINGDLDWAVQIGGEFNDDIHSISIDKADGVLVSGRFTKLADTDNSKKTHLLIAISDDVEMTTAFIARYNAYDGKYIFANTIGITNDNPSSQSQSCIEADEKNNFYLLSPFTNEIDINPNGSPIKYKSKGKNDLVFIKFDMTGKILESLIIGGKGNENCSNKCIAINKKNEVIIAFSFQEKCELNDKQISLNLSATAESDLAVIKLNNKLSALMFSCSITIDGVVNNNQIITDDNDQIWLTGYSKIKYKSTTTGKQKSVPIYKPPTNNYFIYKLNNDGKAIIQKTSSNNVENCALHTIQYNSFTHDLFLGGNFSNTIKWNDYSLKSNGKKDFFILKLKDDFSFWTINKDDTSSVLTTENFTINVKTNTQSTLLNIKYFTNKNTAQNLVLLDYNGNIIKQISGTKQYLGLQQIFYDISYLQAGLYGIKLNNKIKWFTKL